MAVSSRTTKIFTLSVALATAATLAACGAGKKDSGGSDSPSGSASGGTGSTSKPLTIGTTDVITAVDPAGSYDFGSLTIQTNIYQFLMNVPAGATQPVPDAAEKCSFTSPTIYTCTVKPNLKFSNGDPLTAEDVAYSFTRVAKIADPNGPSSLIGNMVSAKATDASTVVFTLKNANDQTWPFVLGTEAGIIVDHKIFPATKLLADAKAIGSGPYMLSSFQKNQLVQLKANPNYTGDNKPKSNQITVKYYTKSDNMKLDIQNGDIDVAWRSLSPTDVDSLSKNNNVKVLVGAGGALRYIVFNLKTMPGKNEEQKLAIRKAIAYSVDRDDLSTNVFKGTYEPAYSMVPQGIGGATEPFKEVFGTKPDKDKAKSVLSAAGVSTPLSIHLDYTTDHYGPSSADEYNQIKRQLEATGLFKVSITGTAYDPTYKTERSQDSYPIYQLGWFPDFVDGDNYLFNFLGEQNFVHAHYCDVDEKTGKPVSNDRPCDKDGVLPLLTKEETQTGAARDQAFAQIQEKLATGTIPYLPLLSGKQVAASGKDVSGVQETLDATYQFRMWMISKS